MRPAGPVDPLAGAEVVSGAWFESRGSVDRIGLADGTILESRQGARWRTAREIEVLIRRAQQVLLLYVPRDQFSSEVYDIGLPTPGEAWHDRLKAQYISDDGWAPEGYLDTALLARRWDSPNQVVLVFEVSC